MTDRALGEAVGQDWVKQNFPPAAKASMDKLVAALEKSLGDDIKTLPWMSDATKKAAEEKLAMIRNKIGYPEKWRDYSALKVKRDDLIGNLHRSAVFERNWNLDQLGKPVDEKEWGMTPPTVNAYYNPSFNDINFPAGILQPPFFDFTIDPAVNFGGIGVVIGHEMTHGFDDEGSKYDGKGNLREWQTAEDRKAFTERTDCVADEYSGFEAAPAHGRHPGAEAERQAHPGREHGRQRRPAHRLHGAAGHAGGAGQEHRRQDRRLHRGAALLPGLCPGVVPEPDRAVGPPGGADRPALARPLARQRHGAELRRSSARPSAAPRASPCTRSTPAASGRPAG